MDKWNNLKMKDRAAVIRMAVQGGYKDLDTIRSLYNSIDNTTNTKENNAYSTGGPLYPFSFSKDPNVKTPVVRYKEGGKLYNKFESGGLKEKIEERRFLRNLNRDFRKQEREDFPYLKYYRDKEDREHMKKLEILFRDLYPKEKLPTNPYMRRRLLLNIGKLEYSGNYTREQVRTAEDNTRPAYFGAMNSNKIEPSIIPQSVIDNNFNKDLYQKGNQILLNTENLSGHALESNYSKMMERYGELASINMQRQGYLKNAKDNFEEAYFNEKLSEEEKKDRFIRSNNPSLVSYFYITNDKFRQLTDLIEKYENSNVDKNQYYELMTEYTNTLNNLLSDVYDQEVLYREGLNDGLTPREVYNEYKGIDYIYNQIEAAKNLPQVSTIGTEQRDNFINNLRSNISQDSVINAYSNYVSNPSEYLNTLINNVEDTAIFESYPDPFDSLGVAFGNPLFNRNNKLLNDLNISSSNVVGLDMSPSALGLYTPRDKKLGTAPQIMINADNTFVLPHELGHSMEDTIGQRITTDLLNKNKDTIQTTYRNQNKDDATLLEREDYYLNPEEINAEVRRIRTENSLTPGDIKVTDINKEWLTPGLKALDDNYLEYLFNRLAYNNSYTGSDGTMFNGNSYIASNGGKLKTFELGGGWMMKII